ncbi:MAG: flagellar biosynthesis protein FlgN [Treponema sp.]|jgi:hypothetical protein|nr:flagellar biosynthesis protein FlgN [Treponema sp.]
MAEILDRETDAAFAADGIMEGTPSPEELAQRVAILKRFRTLLTQQRDRFRSYLEVLDKQKDIIEKGDPDELLAHVELEEKIVADIFSIQRVIDPLEDMYRAALSGFEPAGNVFRSGNREPDEVQSLKTALESMKNEAVIRSTRNKEMLSKRMAELRSEIKSLRNNPYTARRSGFSDGGTASLIDVSG